MALEDEWKIFQASAPESEQEFRTVEFYHSQFDTTIRLVNDFTDKEFTLESGAPRNAGETVTFTSFFLQIEEPEESKEDISDLKISIGGVNNLIQDQIDFISGAGFLEQIQCVYRKYYSEDTSEPVKVLYLEISDVVFDSYQSARMTAQDTDLINKNSGERYTLARFPQLKDT